MSFVITIYKDQSSKKKKETKQNKTNKQTKNKQTNKQTNKKHTFVLKKK